MAWPLTQLGLLLQPSLLHYGGLSGVLHAGVVIAALGLLQRESGLRRAVGWLILGGVALKVGMEQPWQGGLRQTPWMADRDRARGASERRGGRPAVRAGGIGLAPARCARS